MLKVVTFIFAISATVAQYYPYPFLPYHHSPSHLPTYLPAAPPPSAPTTYYIVQAPLPQPIYRPVESAEVSGTTTYAAQPSPPGTITIAAAPPPPSAMPFPGQTYFIASPYPFPPPGATVLQGPSGYPFQAGGTFLQGPTLVAPPYEKKQKVRVTSNRISA